ncbi:hypothetical protein F383_35871 [Gossypium arboreum]|uniref:Uncharacterized protein n=1 Tax=Gossypium arboreum TaxID=29729 RepID=A0A0B0PSP4_GOSAR|nr:hypothetical protein F383_35871 [Gossypium arboreum]
MCFVFFSRC